jgi:soluble lytic murein transglycosylase-like protein
LRDNPNVLDYASEIASASMAWGVESALIRAVIHAESAFNPNAVSPKGAQGLMQLMPQTASRFGVTDSFDPEQNINGGTRYLAWLLTRFDGNERLAVAAYNAGEGAVDRHEGVPPYQETRSYVDRVERLVGVYRQSIEGKTTASNAPVATQVNGPV